MVMHYFGGGIGHLKNAPPLQVLEFDTNSEEMPVEEDDDNPCSGTNEDLGTIVQQPSKDVVNGDDEDEDHDEDDSDCDEDGTDEDDEDDSEEGEDDYGYASA
jgi:hypothetical protein